MKLAALTLLTLASTLAIAQAPTAPYKILKTIKVGGEGGFDYVTADSESRRLYVGRSGPGASFHIYDLDTLTQVGEIPNLSSHGAVPDTRYHHAFATSKPVTMFDTATLATTPIPTAGNPDGYLADPYLHRVYVLSHVAPHVTVIDAKDGAILGTIDIGGAPEQGVVDGKGHLFVDIEDKGAIAVIDTKTMTMTGKFDISSKGGTCAGLAIDTKNGILFAACRDKKNMVILSAADGKILADLPTGMACDGAVFNPATMETFSSQGDGTLTIIKENSPTSFEVEQTVTTLPRAKTLTLDTKTGNIILIAAEFGPVPAPDPNAPPVTNGRMPRAPMLPGTFTILVVGK